ncbi:hypothetical protein CROQUDRAFT_669193 [Cronartium quercuum f. sp. fusiforme G11]|uniref:Uncharacterized protein n=1 Tax=Cronartium quercuum f. sp. fusiforme G11 TaxID=708437 RepID=A0A9P6NLW8_9BASI|nr:hypothetical protein CROQUDRAFT_669193 [Cronartium quercuum f. sp. fusiforme G11]
MADGEASVGVTSAAQESHEKSQWNTTEVIESFGQPGDIKPRGSGRGRGRKGGSKATTGQQDHTGTPKVTRVATGRGGRGRGRGRSDDEGGRGRGRGRGRAGGPERRRVKASEDGQKSPTEYPDRSVSDDKSHSAGAESEDEEGDSTGDEEDQEESEEEGSQEDGAEKANGTKHRPRKAAKTVETATDGPDAPVETSTEVREKKQPYVRQVELPKEKLSAAELEAKMAAMALTNAKLLERKQAADKDAAEYQEIERESCKKHEARRLQQAEIDAARRAAAERKMGKVQGREWDREKTDEDWDRARPYVDSMTNPDAGYRGRDHRGRGRGSGRGRADRARPSRGRGRGGRGRGSGFAENNHLNPGNGETQDQEWDAAAAPDAGQADGGAQGWGDEPIKTHGDEGAANAQAWRAWD